jgi:hypothetical protein
MQFYFFFDTFLCSPKEKYPKETAPCVPLLPVLLETGGALSNSAPKVQGPQTAKGPLSARFCDARRGTMGRTPLLALFFPLRSGHSKGAIRIPKVELKE